MTASDDATNNLLRHYTHGDLMRAVEQSLIALGKDPASVAVGDLAAIDEFHIGGRPASLDLFAHAGFARGMRLLDLGSGLGGPARTCAASCGATVTGIDLTPEYVAVATELSRRVGLAAATHFQTGSILNLPFAPASFDGAYMIHVGMNIADKARLFREVRRVLANGAVFAAYDVMRLSAGDITYPLPWSTSPATSFVATLDDYTAALTAAGFEIKACHDRRAAGLAFIAESARRATGLKGAALPHRGPGWNEKSRNLQVQVESALIGPIQILARAAS